MDLLTLHNILNEQVKSALQSQVQKCQNAYQIGLTVGRTLFYIQHRGAKRGSLQCPEASHTHILMMRVKF